MPPDISELSLRGPDGPKIRVKHFSQSSHKGGDSYVFRCIYSYLWLFIFYLPLLENNPINQ